MIIAAAVLASLLAAGSAAAAEQVGAGRLSATVDAAPWGIEVSDAKRGRLLSELGSAGSGPSGSLGFRTASGWFHATRAISLQRRGQGLSGVLETTDPLGRRIGVRIAPEDEGAIAIEAELLGSGAGVEAIGIGFGSPPNERFLGFGERSTSVEQRGNTVESRVADGPYQPEERPFIRGFVPPAGFSDRDDATYFPMPWLLSTGGYGVLLENLETSYFRLASDRSDAWSVEAEATRMRLVVFAGPEPAQVVRRLTRHTGRQPPPAAPWVFGPWYQPTGGDELEGAELMREADVPVSVAQTYLHYLPCGDQQGIEADQPPRTAALHEQGLAVTTYFNPMICSNYQPAYGQAVAAGVLTEDSLGQPYLYRYAASTEDLFFVAQFDFSEPAADSFYGRLLAEAVDDGYDGWMEDFGEYTPEDARSANGMPGTRMHNLYPVLYHRAAHRFKSGVERPLVSYVRSGYTGVHPYAQVVWGGDPTVDWGFDGLSSAVTQALSLGTSGISRWGSDIGGFFALGPNRLTPELLIRWIQLGAVSPVMRTQANGVALPPQADRPQVDDPEILPIWRRYAKLHNQLYPYISAADATYRRSGLPIMRQMALSYPGDPRSAELEDQFMFGPDLLAAPVLEPGSTKRQVELPRGRWIDFWRSASYRERNGSIAPRRSRAIRGGGSVSLKAPLEELPMLVRAGAVIPMLPATVDTLAPYGSAEEGIVRLADRRRRIVLLAFPRGRSKAAIGERGRLSSRARAEQWSLRLRGQRRTHYRLRASLGAMRSPLRPCRILVDGKRLPERAWSYNRRKRTLDAQLRGKGRTVRVRVLGHSRCR